ncbi:protein with ADP-ribose binding module, MACRO superfamily [Psychroflexus torquis ATCC 700755]|uniref:Protein with ADP-ribose binding module, MACRO superfamily n=1 Tax=Psychroflexus torquis (strain ATCC 700755 / CIP 106069 / ACAM 623) TaxID=313595 RepID=K4IFX1_PSYTT|nr:macro domain-containing protein [Psychroflexus torquis]AFU69432.1 protein with ADP-ribose binding module, MACRO superfamily [Psychroflexus torquis ATCC 700755]
MKIIEGNIFTTDCQTIVNTVNCFGIMGAGIALECRYRYPEMFERYKEMCDKKLLDIGKLYLYQSNTKWILNFPTKNHWKFPTKPIYLEKGLLKFKETYEQKKIQSIAFPLLGAQNGGLSKDESLELLQKHLKGIEIPIEIYIYKENASDDLYNIFKTAFLSNNLESLKRLTDLKSNQIKKITEILENEDLKNMGQLSSFKGIGETTISKCFNYAMRPDIKNIQKKLF